MPTKDNSEQQTKLVAIKYKSESHNKDGLVRLIFKYTGKNPKLMGKNFEKWVTKDMADLYERKAAKAKDKPNKKYRLPVK